VKLKAKHYVDALIQLNISINLSSEKMFIQHFMWCCYYQAYNAIAKLHLIIVKE